MKVTYNWLKDFVAIKIPAQTLAEKLTMAGLEVVSLEERGGDFIFEIEVTSNRPDWLSVAGVAREVAAITQSSIKHRESSIEHKLKNAKTPFTIKIDNKKDCPLYTAKILRGVTVAASPEWLRKRLELAGLRSVNNIVDITNYVLLERGQPLHAFDMDKLSGEQIVVRRAKPGERITTIDGEQKPLDPQILVIADARCAVAAAGVMGGKDTEVNFGTKNILLEAAVFDPLVVRHSRKLLGLDSESSYRFERGVNAQGLDSASWQAIELMQKLAGGACALAKSAGSAKKPGRSIKLSVGNAQKILGAQIPARKMKKILSSLGFKVSGNFTVKVPSWRQDVSAEIDLIEEISRIFGYAAIPKTLPAVRPQVRPDTERDLVSAVKNILAGLGLSEVITYSLTDAQALKYFPAEGEPVEVLNPLSKEQAVLRTTLIPGLAACVSANFNQKQPCVNIFEVAKTFALTAAGVKEELALGIALAGRRTLLFTDGAVKDEEGLAHLKGTMEALFNRLGIKDYDFQAASGAGAQIIASGQKLGRMFALSKEALERAGIKNKDVFCLEVSLEKILELAHLEKKFLALPKYPAVERDISFVLKDDVPVSRVLAQVKEKGAPFLVEVKISDYYKGKQIPAGYRGLTVSCFYRAGNRTLTEAQIQPLHEGICALLTERFSAQIR